MSILPSHSDFAGVPFAALGPRDCRYELSPVGVAVAAFRFCGARCAPLLPYCPTHAAVTGARPLRSHAEPSRFACIAPREGRAREVAATTAKAADAAAILQRAVLRAAEARKTPVAQPAPRRSASPVQAVRVETEQPGCAPQREPKPKAVTPLPVVLPRFDVAQLRAAKASKKRPLPRIIDLAERFAGAVPGSVLSPTHNARTVIARKIVCVLLVGMNGMTISAVGRRIGRDHSTVHYAVHSLAALCGVCLDGEGSEDMRRAFAHAWWRHLLEAQA